MKYSDELKKPRSKKIETNRKTEGTRIIPFWK